MISILLPVPLTRALGFKVLALFGWYLKRQVIEQRVWVNGFDVVVGQGRIRSWAYHTVNGEPMGLTLFWEKDDPKANPKRVEVIKLTDLKLDKVRNVWHFVRPGYPDMKPRVPKKARKQ